MITALALICNLETGACESAASKAVYTDMDVCTQSVDNATEYAESKGMVLMSFKCYNWGEAS